MNAAAHVGKRFQDSSRALHEGRVQHHVKGKDGYGQLKTPRGVVKDAGGADVRAMNEPTYKQTRDTIAKWKANPSHFMW